MGVYCAALCHSIRCSAVGLPAVYAQGSSAKAGGECQVILFQELALDCFSFFVTIIYCYRCLADLRYNRSYFEIGGLIVCAENTLYLVPACWRCLFWGGCWW